jgi:L-ectoine synthase
MIVRKLANAENSSRRVVSRTWESTRLLLKDDRMGFSFHITTIYAGTTTEMHYRNHLEAVYCISGTGRIEIPSSGAVHSIEPGTIYALDQHDHHLLHAQTELKLACVFNPPLNGKEVHDETGAYPLTAETIEG